MKSVLVSCIVVICSILFTRCSSDSKAPSTNSSTSTVSTTDTTASAKPNIEPVTEMYTCTMHNEVLSSKPGTCPKCGMKLVKKTLTTAQQKMVQEGSFIKSKEEQ